MHPTDKAFDRLLKSAKEGQPDQQTVPSRAFESRLFRALRNPRPNAAAFIIQQIRIGLACAAAFTLAAALLSYLHPPLPAAPEVDITSSTWTILAND